MRDVQKCYSISYKLASLWVRQNPCYMSVQAWSFQHGRISDYDLENKVRRRRPNTEHAVSTLGTMEKKVTRVCSWCYGISHESCTVHWELSLAQHVWRRLRYDMRFVVGYSPLAGPWSLAVGRSFARVLAFGLPKAASAGSVRNTEYRVRSTNKHTARVVVHCKPVLLQ